MNPESAFKRSTYWAFPPENISIEPTQAGLLLSEPHWPEKFHHWVRVSRIQTGETISLIRNQTRTVCEVTDIAKKQIACRVLLQEEMTVPTPRITAAVCLIPHDRWEWMLEKLVELGVQKIIAVQSQFTQSKHIPKDWDKTRSRWERIILSAAEQSEQPVLAQLEPMITHLNDLELDNLFLANERLDHGHRATWPALSTEHVSFLIGPAGGWSPEELAFFEAHGTQGYHAVSLGARILRTETAAITMTVLLNDRYT